MYHHSTKLVYKQHPVSSDTSSSETRICGIVLAGGLSSRMGRDKLLLSVHGDGKDMLTCTFELLSKVTDRVFVSCRTPEGVAFPVIPDDMERQGPLGGILTTLRRLRAPLLVLSCDLPFMDRPTLHRLLAARTARRPGTIMTSYREEKTGVLEPLVSIYEPECLPWFEEAQAGGLRKLGMVIPESLRTEISYTLPTALPFFNINYPADFEAARRLSSLMRQSKETS